MKLMVGEIFIAKGRRPINEDAMPSLMASIKEIGLQYPVTVREVDFWHDEELGDQDGAYVLVAGAHRLEACKRLGMFHIDANVETWDQDTARMWEISENLHRAELKALEKDEQIEEWRKLHVSKVAKIAPPSGGDQPKERGIRKTAETLGIHRKEVHNAMRVASLPEEAKRAARETGLDDNRSALLEAVNSDDPVRSLRERATRKSEPKVAADPLDDALASERQVARLMDAWNAAGPDARQEFLLRIDAPVFDRGAAA